MAVLWLRSAAAGDSVVAGARRTQELEPLVAQYGDRVKPATLEVRDEAAAKAIPELLNH